MRRAGSLPPELQDKHFVKQGMGATVKDNIRKLELQILKMLAEATGDILDNIELRCRAHNAYQAELDGLASDARTGDAV